MVRTCTVYVPLVVRAELVQLVAVVTPKVVEEPPGYVTLTCAASCAEPSGWFGVHDTVAVEPLAIAPAGADTMVGAKGGVTVTSDAESVQSDASAPLTARTRKRTVPAPTPAEYGRDAFVATLPHVEPPS